MEQKSQVILTKFRVTATKQFCLLYYFILLCEQNEVLILQCTFVSLTIYFVYGTKILSDNNKI